MTLKISGPINPTASVTLEVTYPGISKSFNRLVALPLNETFAFEVKEMTSSEYSYKILVRESKILVDVWF